jgi:hypothetical protein
MWLQRTQILMLDQLLSSKMTSKHCPLCLDQLQQKNGISEHRNNPNCNQLTHLDAIMILTNYLNEKKSLVLYCAYCKDLAAEFQYSQSAYATDWPGEHHVRVMKKGKVITTFGILPFDSKKSSQDHQYHRIARNSIRTLLTDEPMLLCYSACCRKPEEEKVDWCTLFNQWLEAYFCGIMSHN